MKGVTGTDGLYWFVRASKGYMHPIGIIGHIRFVLYLPVAYVKYLYVTYKG